MMTWLKSLFSKSTRERHTFLTKQEVENIEDFLSTGRYHEEEICAIYGISKTTIYRIRNGMHRFSTPQGN